MRLLLWHGYLLHGTGSNVYTRGLAREWSRSGHDVVVFTQEREPERAEGAESRAAAVRRHPEVTRSTSPSAHSAPRQRPTVVASTPATTAIDAGPAPRRAGTASGTRRVVGSR